MQNGIRPGIAHSAIPRRTLGWVAAAALLLAPLVAMQFTRKVNWSPADFAFAAVMIGAVGAAFEFAVRRSESRAYRGGVAAALAAAFLIVWTNGAVGMVGDEGNPANLMFGVVLAIALIGSTLARFRARGMAIAMAAAALGQAVAGGIGMLIDPLGGLFSTAFATLWLLAASLFHRAAGRG